MYRTPENILSSGKIIYQGEHEFMPKKYAVEAVETARLEVAEFFINLSGIFGHYKFFTNELWRKVKGFKKQIKVKLLQFFFIIGFIINLDLILVLVDLHFLLNLKNKNTMMNI